MPQWLTLNNGNKNVSQQNVQLEQLYEQTNFFQRLKGITAFVE